MKSFTRLLMITLLAVTTVGLQLGHAGDGGGDITYKSTVFSHDTHVDGAGFDCDSCHDGMFEMEAGAMTADGAFSMDTIYDGESCGACHDGDTAFAADEDCTTCHVKDGGDILYTEPVKSVIFSHEIHADGFGCESCHTGMFKMESLAAQKNKDFTMNSLYQGEYCGACHDGDTAFASDTRCATCHLGVKGYNRLIGDGQEKSH